MANNHMKGSQHHMVLRGRQMKTPEDKLTAKIQNTGNTSKLVKMCINKNREPACKGYIPYNSNYMLFQVRQNHREYKKFSG